MTYSEKLRDPRWQKKRLKIFERDDWHCRKCNDSQTNLQIHHVDYFPDTDPWDYTDDMLLTLCEPCHALEQKRNTHEKDLLTSLKMNGFLAFHVWNLASKLYSDTRFKDHLKAILSK